MNFSIKEWLSRLTKSNIFRKGHWNTKDFSSSFVLLLLITSRTNNVYNKSRDFSLLTNSPLKYKFIITNYKRPDICTHLIKMIHPFDMPRTFVFPSIPVVHVTYPTNLTIFHSVPLRLYQFCTNIYCKFCDCRILSHYIIYNYIFQLQSHVLVNHTIDLYEIIKPLR